MKTTNKINKSQSGVSSGKIESKYALKETLKTFIIFTIMSASVFPFTSFIMSLAKNDNVMSLQFFTTGMIILTVICISVPFITALLTYLYSVVYVNTFEYETSEKFLKIKSGVFTRKKVTIPFSRIQNLNITRGVFDRLFDLYTVKVETAGFGGASSQSGGIIKPEGYIPGIKDPSKLEKITRRLIHEYTQEVPEKIKSQVFTDNVLAYDEFIAYLLTRMAEVEEIKTRVKELRNKAGITQDELGKEVGVSRQTIIALEQGKYVPSLTLAMKIARKFNVSVEEIFELDEKDYSKKKGKSVI